MIKFRKKTTPVHILCGMVTAIACAIYPVLGIVMALSFMLFEYWQERKESDSGCMDFWEFLAGLMIGASLLLMKWWLFDFRNVVEVLESGTAVML